MGCLRQSKKITVKGPPSPIFGGKRGSISEKGLGDVVLEAYDRTAQWVDQRQKSLSGVDPNAGVTDPMSRTWCW